MLNVALGHNTRPTDANKEDWHSPSSVEEALEVIHEFADEVKELIKLAPEVKVYTLASRDPLPMLNKGKAVIVGDAACIMTPTHAQGGTLALEHAAALELLFNGARKGDVEARARDFDGLMRKHSQIVQLLSNGTRASWAPKNTKEKVMQMIKEHEGGDGGFAGREPPSENSMPFCEAARDFIYPYDVFEEYRKFVGSRQ
jgi:salicylate hydroxylase